MVNGNTAVITGVVKTNTPEKIKLELKDKANGAQNVIIDYVKSSDPAKQLKSTDGGTVESFSIQIGEPSQAQA